MSLFSVQARKHTAYYDHLMSTSRTSGGRGRPAERKTPDTTLETSGTTSGESTCGDSRTSETSRQVHRTHVVSALSKSGGGQQTPPRGRLTLQRRSRRRTGGEQGEKTGTESSLNSTKAPEKRLTLQRRTRTPSMDKGAPGQRGISGAGGQPPPKVLSEPNGRYPSVFRSASVREAASRSKSRETPVETKGRLAPSKTPSSSSSSSSSTRQLEDQAQTFKTPTKKTPFHKIAAKRDVFERMAAREVPRVVSVKSASLERPKSRMQQAQEFKPAPAPRVGKASAGVHRPSPVLGGIRTSSSNQRGDVTQARTSTPAPAPAPAPILAPAPAPTSSEQPRSRPSEAVQQQDSLKMEDSAVTVAVRVRPFSAREKAEKASQVIFMKGQETIVQHPESKQSFSFTYDLSFCSVDEKESTFASQQTVYETLARPLLLRAFEGFNTCLFAYGQTGSGKSYTMMGFGEEAGVIPRFCRELFSRLTAIENKEVKCHVEMSYFEVYNEKIHDLLITRDDPNQRRMPLRVREHPVHGPYVAELSTNVVSSYNDIQGWLGLGNKQRATAATGMNDKSSRSHSVFTLVMTQTKTEFVEDEEHDHSISSRINLVDLAGSERCKTAQTSGDRLREGASINKSLLTLGKVISALSEQALTRKKVFIPYRESVLTWLLKESLGGNSKTAMIATLSPAGSSVEETLSTLRYAQQARTIINVAKVNEDTSAKLIRELKAEVEKLRAAQMSSQGIEPDRVRLFLQEITALKTMLCQQEREMVEANRAWREKLEQAEIRKREETKELQKAGVTLKVDNRLPNLVNLNEDPQLSEMLLYMIKEGQTTVGKLKSDSSRDIQLNGALIADQHCVINSIQSTVSITPMESAKTFVNGNLISESTVLNHGDRVILGGDHYFRFNHPAEVQSGKRVSCWTGSGDGQKDFEFAKNELVKAQRAQLEAEIEEAHLKAKEEMMQGIQMAKDVAQKELCDQRALYENRIRGLERELNEESAWKRQQELDQQRVASQMAELKVAKLGLEQEVDSQKKHLRLHMEAQAMEEHRVSQVRIVEALEAEKKKIGRELEELQKKRALREIHTPRNVSPHWDAMKMSLMIEEANKISSKLKKNTIFRRHESSDSENLETGGLPQVRVQNTKLGISTFWNLDKFQNNMAAMRELEQGDSTSKDDDVFYDPDDEWEQDISASSASTSSFSRRRSRSYLKSRRISGRLYEIRVHPIQSLLNGSSPSAGLMGVSKPPSTHSTSTDSALPGICKELIGQSVARLRGCSATEESLADRLASDLNRVYEAVQTLSDLYDSQDDDSQENVFVCNLVAQTQLVKAATAMESAAFVTRHWLVSVKPVSGFLYTITEELNIQVKKMGGFFQLLIQGCESEITSMVTEARRKSSQCLDAALLALGHLAAVTCMPLNAMELGAQATGKPSMTMCVLNGTSRGVRSLLNESLTITREMLRDAQLAYPRNPGLQSLKSKMLDLACALQSYMHCHISEKESDSEEVEEWAEEASASHLKQLMDAATKLFQLNQAIRLLHSSLSAALRGKDRDSDLGSGREQISSSAKAVDELILGLSKEGALRASSQLPCLQSVLTARDTLHSALQSLSSPWNEQGAGEGRSSAASDKSTEEDILSKESASTHTAVRNRLVSKIVYTLPSVGSPHWV
ncbi:kinesin-like protein KIF14 [Limanda limanda]|uniref:kinesin-like protein KIF14 n=1 Tax=Limanda limanda TaxID=27771 RepID=UPI0029C6DEF9|nr:kinesin-like protein KIF14 [Limanda limanda]